jgi:hypothetical protein
VPSKHFVTFTAAGADGNALIVTVTAVLVELSQPVAVILAAAYAVVVPAVLLDGATVTVPPVASVYHTIVSPAPAVADPVYVVPS